MKRSILFSVLIMGATLLQARSITVNQTCGKNGQVVKANPPATAQAVDLGLSVKWANMNVGSTKPEYSGDYFAWGETEKKATYDGSNYSDIIHTKYDYYGGKTVLDPEDDAAHVNWGGSWRMPTKAEWQELLDYCTWTWTTQNGKYGYKVTSKKAGYTDKFIFLPTTGYSQGRSKYDEGTAGHYWSSLVGKMAFSQSAWCLYFYSDGRGLYGENRYIGRKVRPVLSNSTNANDTIRIYSNGCDDYQTFIGSHISPLTMTANSDKWSHFVRWQDGNTDNPRAITTNGNADYTAYFETYKFSVHVQSDDAVRGSGYISKVVKEGSIEYNESVGTFDAGSEVYLASQANYGYHFTQWSDGNTFQLRSFILARDTTFTATFAKNIYSITKNAEHGTISGNSSAEYLDFVTLTATPDYGYHFVQWSDGNTDNPRTFVLTQDTTFTVEFAIDKSGTCGKNNLLQWAFADSGILTISGNGELTENYTYGVEAPSKMQNLIIEEGITSIGKSAFSGCNALRTVTLNSNAVASKTYTSSSTIGAIFGSQITQYIIGNNVTDIGDYAFYNCKNITSIILGDNLTTIGKHAFRNCTGLTSVDIPNNVMSIGYASFYDCSGLTSVTLGNNVQTIGDWAFRGCIGLTSINIPNSVKSIGGKVFCVCSGLTSIEIPNSVTSLGAGAFLQCTNLQSAKISTNVSELNGFLFSGCVNLRTLSFSSNVTSFGDSLFHNCQSLTMMIVPDKVTSIGTGMAANCKNIRSITIGKSVTSIGQNAFTGCNNIKQVEWKAINSPSWNFGSQVETFTFGEEVQVIPANLCSGMNKLTEIKIPETVVSIGNNAFNGCENITSLALPAALTSIGNYAFANINNRQLTSLVMPAELQTIGDYAFSNNTYLESIDFNAKLQSIGAYAFKDCYRVSEMTCLATVTPNVGTDALASINSYASLCVPEECLKKYKVDPNWGRFDLCELGTTSTVTDSRTVTVEPTDNTAIFTWPTENNAASYSLQITKDGVVFCTLVFNSNGQLTGIAFVPGRNGAAHAPAATMSVAGMSFTVTGLNVASKYAYRLAVADDASEELIAYRGEFATTGYDGEVNPGGNPEGIEDVFTDEHKAFKILHNGQILILRGEKIYTVTGQEVK